LGIGTLDHSVNIAALSFSKEAIKKIQESGGKYLTLPEVYELKKNIPNIKIIG